MNFFNISAPLWIILGSLLVSSLIEKEHFSSKSKVEKAKNSKEEIIAWNDLTSRSNS